jgi:hypothetical protein
MQANTNGDGAAAGLPIVPVFIRGAERWMTAQTQFLTSIETVMTGWAERQRRAFEAGSRSLRKIYGSRNILDLVEAQHELVSDYLQWTASEIRAAADEATEMTRKAAERLDDTGNRPREGDAPRAVASDVVVQRAAAE